MIYSVIKKILIVESVGKMDRVRKKNHPEWGNPDPKLQMLYIFLLHVHASF